MDRFPRNAANLFTLSQVARLLKRSRASLFRDRRAGRLRAFRTGGKVLVSSRQIEDFLGTRLDKTRDEISTQPDGEVEK